MESYKGGKSGKMGLRVSEKYTEESLNKLRKKITKSNIETWKNPEIKRRRSAGISKARLKGKTYEEIFPIIERLIHEKNSSGEIVKKINISQPTIYKILKKLKKTQLELELRDIGYKKIISSNYKNGQSALYEKIRKRIKTNNIKCENCNSLKNVEIHHKEKIHYDKNWNAFKADNWNNSRDNIIFLCNSCHQKLHWKDGSRILKVKQNKETGRFIKNESL